MSSIIGQVLPWLIGTIVVGAVAYVVWRLFLVGTSNEAESNQYLSALELWIEGDLAGATKLLRRVVEADSSGVEPFIHLGNLLRLQGDFETAAILHRGLTARQTLTREQKVTVGLALAEDLNALERWEESGEVLDSILRHATGRTRYWRIRFRQRHGAGDQPEAARSLKHAPGQLPHSEHQWFRRAYASYQLDRALHLALAGEADAARARLKDVRDMEEARSRSALIKAIIAALKNDTTAAVTLATEELLHHPAELAVFLPLLQKVLLETGQYARTIPILERACQADEAPASLWIDLALLYEKIDQRDRALRLLGAKEGREGFTPNVAAPYLRLLLGEVDGSDAARVWGLLAKPEAHAGWTCQGCGSGSETVRWFCPDCGRFDSYGESSGTNTTVVRSSPVERSSAHG